MSNSSTNIPYYIAKEESLDNFNNYYNPLDYKRPYRIVLLPIRLGTIKLFFLGKEITKFLDNYKRITTNSMLATKQKITSLPNFCNNSCCRFIKRLKPY